MMQNCKTKWQRRDPCEFDAADGKKVSPGLFSPICHAKASPISTPTASVIVSWVACATLLPVAFRTYIMMGLQRTRRMEIVPRIFPSRIRTGIIFIRSSFHVGGDEARFPPGFFNVNPCILPLLSFGVFRRGQRKFYL